MKVIENKRTVEVRDSENKCRFFAVKAAFEEGFASQEAHKYAKILSDHEIGYGSTEPSYSERYGSW